LELLLPPNAFRIVQGFALRFGKLLHTQLLDKNSIIPLIILLISSLNTVQFRGKFYAAFNIKSERVPVIEVPSRRGREPSILDFLDFVTKIMHLVHISAKISALKHHKRALIVAYQTPQTRVNKRQINKEIKKRCYFRKLHIMLFFHIMQFYLVYL